MTAAAAAKSIRVEGTANWLGSKGGLSGILLLMCIQRVMSCVAVAGFVFFNTRDLQR